MCAFLCPCSPPALWTQLSLTPPSGHRGPCPHRPDPLARPLEFQSLAGPTRSLSLPPRWWPPPRCSPDLRFTDAFSPWQGSLRPQIQMFEALTLCAVSEPTPCAPGTSCLRDVCPCSTFCLQGQWDQHALTTVPSTNHTRVHAHVHTCRQPVSLTSLRSGLASPSARPHPLFPEVSQQPFRCFLHLWALPSLPFTLHTATRALSRLCYSPS